MLLLILLIASHTYSLKIDTDILTNTHDSDIIGYYDNLENGKGIVLNHDKCSKNDKLNMYFSIDLDKYGLYILYFNVKNNKYYFEETKEIIPGLENYILKTEINNDYEVILFNLGQKPVSIKYNIHYECEKNYFILKNGEIMFIFLVTYSCIQFFVLIYCFLDCTKIIKKKDNNVKKEEDSYERYDIEVIDMKHDDIKVNNNELKINNNDQKQGENIIREPGEISIVYDAPN